MKTSIGISALLVSSLLWTPTLATGQDQKPGAAVTICVYRPRRYVGSALKPSVFIDQIEITRLHNGESVQVTVPSGQHRVNSNDKSTGIDLEAKAGQTYYLRVDIQAGAWKGHGAITLIDPQEGKYEFSQQKLALTRDLASDRGTTAQEVNHTSPPEPVSTQPRVVEASASDRASSQPKVVSTSASEEAATISVASTPDGAEIYADGTFIGNAPANLRLSAGKHTIRVTQPDYKDWSREIGVQAGSDARVIATMQKK